MRQFKVVEIVLTYISLGWTYVLFTSPTLFENSPQWDQLKTIANYEWVLALVTLVCAITKIIGIALQHRRLRWLGLIMSTILWIVVASSFLVSGDGFNLTTGFVVYTGIAVMSLWTSKEVMTDDREE